MIFVSPPPHSGLTETGPVGYHHRSERNLERYGAYLQKPLTNKERTTMVQESQGNIDSLKSRYRELAMSPDFLDNPAKRAEADDVLKQIDAAKKRQEKLEKAKKKEELSQDREEIWNESLSDLFYLKQGDKYTNKPFLMVRKNDSDMSMDQIQFNLDDLSDKLIGNPRVRDPLIALAGTFDAKKDGGIEENYERTLKWIMNHLRINQKNVLSDVPNWSNRTNEPCIHYIPLETEEGPTPCWDQFLDRLELKDEFLAFIWSAFDVRDRGRQIFWIRDSGAGGKSSVVRALETWMGNAAKSIGLDNLKNTHGTESITHKRLLIDPDSNLVFAISDVLVHKITGADTVNVNPKGRSMFSTNMFAKILFMSNYLPSISEDKKNERTRLILSELRPRATQVQGMDTNWEQGLITEKRQLLHKAKDAYDRLVKNYEIPTGRVNYALIETGEIEFINEHIEKKGYKLNPKAQVLRSEFIQGLEKAFKGRTSDRGHALSFRDTYQRYLVERGVTHKRVRNPLGGEVTYLVGIGVIQEEAAEPDDVIL